MPTQRRTHNHTPDDQNTGPATPELSTDMNREQLLDYFGSQSDRISSISKALGGENNEWQEDSDFFKSGHALNYMIDRVHNEPFYTPSETDVLIGKYIDADIKETTARNSINDDKLLAVYGDKAETGNEAVFAHIDAISESLKKHNTKIANKLGEYPKLKDPDTPVPLEAFDKLSNRSVGRLVGNRQANMGIIGDVKRAHDVLDQKNIDKIDATAFVGLVDKYANGEIDTATFEEAKKELEANTQTLDRAADAYMLVVGDENHDFKEDEFIQALELEKDEKRTDTIGKQQAAQKTAEKPVNAKTEQEEQAQQVPLPTPRGKGQKGTTAPTSAPVTTPTPSGTTTGAHPQNPAAPTPAVGGQAPDTQNTAPTRPERPDGLSRRDLQQIRVENAAAALQASSLGRSKQLLGTEQSDFEAEALHRTFSKEVYNLMQFDRPAILDDPSITREEKNAYISQYAFEHYHTATMATVESMGGEKDPKKRKRNAHILRFGGAALGFVLGGPAGMVVGGSIGLGISKGLDSEMKKREQLKNAVQRFEAQAAADNYLNTPDREGEPYSEEGAFYAATGNLRMNFENGLVKRRRLNIGKAALTGSAWTVGTIVVAHEAAAGLQYLGDQAFQTVSRLSWSGTGAPWEGGLNPNFNYTMHEKPVSMKVLGGLFSAANPTLGITAGAAILAGFGGLKLVQDGPDAKKKNNNGRAHANAA